MGMRISTDVSIYMSSGMAEIAGKIGSFERYKAFCLLRLSDLYRFAFLCSGIERGPARS